MIRERDVLRMRVPYPSISGKLALSSHMYICREADVPCHKFVKCQTLKPYMLSKAVFFHYIDEEADETRNPFQRTTRIDCDKVFVTSSVAYDDKLKTTIRPDICQELYHDVVKELNADGYDRIEVDEQELVHINSMITKV